MSVEPHLTRSLRLIAIIRLFEDGQRLTTRELAERFGVSTRTAQDDIKLLRGAPLYMPIDRRYLHAWQLVRVRDAENLRNEGR